MTDDDMTLAEATRRFGSLTSRMLRDYREALALDREAAIGGVKTVKFCTQRIALIDALLAARGDDGEV